MRSQFSEELAGGVVTEGGYEAGAGEGVAPLKDDTTGGPAAGGAGLVDAGCDTVGVAGQPAWGVPDNNNRGDRGSYKASLWNSDGYSI